jgi:hypothetical protein
MAERVGTFFSSLRQDWSYAGSLAGVLLIGIGAIQMALPRKVLQVTAKDSAVQSAPGIAGTQTVPYRSDIPFEIAPNEKRGNPNLREVRTLRVGPPRFIIDTMPASYEQTQIRF